MANQSMKRADWALVVTLLLSIWALDQVTKVLAVRHFTGPMIFGPFGFYLHFNPGVIFGTWANLPPILRVVSLSTAGAFLIFIYAAIQYLLPSRAIFLRSGMSMLLGGILGNVTDRIVRGEVVDFVFISLGQFRSSVFNVADAVQWVGYGFLVYGMFKEGKTLWPDINSRKSLWVNPGFQLKFCLMITAIGLGFSIVSGVFAYTYLKITIDALLAGPVMATEQTFLIPFLLTYAVMSIGFMLTLFILGRILSHRLAGPIHAFEKYIRDLLEGKEHKLRLRQGDEFRTNLEELADRLKPMVKDRRKARR